MDVIGYIPNVASRPRTVQTTRPQIEQRRTRAALIGTPMEHCSKGQWSDECLWRDTFSLWAGCCSRCCLFRMPICRNCRLPPGQIPTYPLSASIPIGNGRSALFTIPISRRSFLRTSRTQIASRLRQRSPMPRSRRWRHLLSCKHPMPTSYGHPIPKSGNRRCNANAKLRSDPRRRPQSSWRSDPNLAFLGEASGEQRADKVLSSIKGLIGRHLGASMEGSWKQDGECPLLSRSFPDRAGQKIRVKLHNVCFCLSKLSTGFDQSNDGA
jgi:hypothetical protein